MPHQLIPRLILDQYTYGQQTGQFQAASLFVDVSGFTAISEALMQHGKGGAEALADVMQAIFDPLVQAVYAQHGYITSFAGDAFTALFPNDIKTPGLLHALAAAWDIRQHMAAHPSSLTPFGRHTVSVHMGLAIGLAEWGVITHCLPEESAPRRQQAVFYFKGMAIDACAQAHQHANSSELVLHESAWPGLSHTVDAERLPNGAWRVTGLNGELPPPGNAASPEMPKPPLDDCPFFPRELFETPLRGEFRPVVSVFINLPGDPGRAELAALMQPCFSLLDQYSGYLNRLDFGDKGCRLMLLWGAPHCYENDLERAMQFVLDLQAASALPLRAGITSGMAYAGFIGAAQREEYTAYSQRVNLAARLAAAAPWGQIWMDASADMLPQADRQFEIRRLKPIPLKGFTEPQEVRALLGSRVFEESPQYQGRMVARSAELARLEDFIAPLRGGQFAGVLTIYGEPGLGKSRLLYEFRQNLGRLQPFLWLEGQADQILRRSLNPFEYLLRRYFDQSPNRPPENNRRRFEALFAALEEATAEPLRAELVRARPFLGAWVGLHWEGSLYEQVEPRLRFENTLYAFRTFIHAVSQRQAVILVLEDAHWLDADSHALLHVLTRCAAAPFAVLCVARYLDDNTDTHGRLPYTLETDTPQAILDLDRLTPQAIRDFVGQVLGGMPSEALAAFLAEKANGNPFFAEQLALDLQERGALYLDGAAQQWELVSEKAAGHPQKDSLPPGLNAVLVARLDRLAADVRNVVQTAAVLGREFEVQVLSYMLRQDAQLPAKIRRAEDESIWSALNEIRYIFKHALLRDAAYDMQLGARLRGLHGLAAESIQAVFAANLPAHTADLAHHYDQAGEAAQAAHWYRQAGELAAARYANAEAVAAFSRALELLPETEIAKRYAVLCARESIYDITGARQLQVENLAALETLAAALGPTQQAEVALRRGNLADLTGEPPDAVITIVRQVVALAETNNDVYHQAAGRRLWGRALARQGCLSEALAHLRQARALAQSGGLRQLEAEALRGIAVVYWLQGDCANDRLYGEQALEIYREIGDRRGEAVMLQNLAGTCGDEGDYGACRQYLQQAIPLLQTVGERVVEAYARSNLGEIARICGDIPTALRYFEQAERISQESGFLLGLAMSLNGHALTLAMKGESAVARQLCQQAMQISAAIESNDDLSGSHSLWGDLLVEEGCFDKAAQSYEQALALRRAADNQPGIMETLASLGSAALAAGKLPLALKYAEEVIAYLEEHALTGLNDRQNTYWQCYKILAEAKDPRAAAMLQKAYKLLQELAAKVGDEEVQRTFRENVPLNRKIIAAFEGT